MVCTQNQVKQSPAPRNLEATSSREFAKHSTPIKTRLPSLRRPLAELPAQVITSRQIKALLTGDLIINEVSTSHGTPFRCFIGRGCASARLMSRPVKSTPNAVSCSARRTVQVARTCPPVGQDVLRMKCRLRSGSGPVPGRDAERAPTASGRLDRSFSPRDSRGRQLEPCSVRACSLKFAPLKRGHEGAAVNLDPAILNEHS